VKTFRQPFYQTVVILVMLTSWLFMLGSSTCVMPFVVQSPAEPVVMSSDCDDVTHHVDHQKLQTELQKKDCVLKPCPDSQQHPALNSKVSKLDIPVFLLCLIAVITVLYNPYCFRIFPRRRNEHFANSIPIRYRFCVLLN
jgi:hypothetical protein